MIQMSTAFMIVLYQETNSHSPKALGIQFHFFLHSLNLHELRSALCLDFFFFFTNVVMLIQNAH